MRRFSKVPIIVEVCRPDICRRRVILKKWIDLDPRGSEIPLDGYK